ncbi:IS6 family transposase, partial [Bacillus nitratireducens]|nr:IS6 family transposase [Bacillus nitratireducens]
IISGIEAKHMVKKEPFILLVRSVQNQVNFIHQIFGIVA